MALERKDNIGDTTTTTGTGTITLAAVAQSGARIFAGNVTSGATVRYDIRSSDNTEWEIGEGVFTDGSPDTLTRVTVYASSNAGALVNFSAGTKNVSLVMTAEDANGFTPSNGWNTYSDVAPTLASSTKDKYTLTFAGVDLTSKIGVGHKVKMVQTVGNNTNSLDLELSSTQYATKTDTASLSITGEICLEAWVKIESISASGMAIASKFYQDGGVKSYMFYITPSGFLSVIWSGDGFNESGATATNGAFNSSDIGRWVHVALSLTPSTKTATMYKDGVALTVGAGTGTQTSINDNTTTFAIGARDVQGTPDTLFDGLLSEVRLWNTTRTQQQVRENMFHNLVGNESGLVGYWKLNNSYADSTSNANDLTSSGSPVFSSSVPPKLTNATKYGIVSSISFSTDTTLQVMTGSDYGIDGGIISAFNYSLMDNPVGFPVWMNYFSDGPTGTSIESRFTTHGRTAECYIRGTATGAMTWTNLPTLPLTVSANALSRSSDSSGDGVGGYLDSGTVNVIAGLTPNVGPSGTVVRVANTANSTIVSATNPITWAAGDTWDLHFSYEF